jgi:hypothetical protein
VKKHVRNDLILSLNSILSSKIRKTLRFFYE